MISEFQIKSTSESIQKSFKNFERDTLPQYTTEQVVEEISKGDKLFLTKEKLIEFRDSLVKSEDSDKDEILGQIKRLQPVVVNKSDNSYDIGYFLPIEKKEEAGK